MSDDKLFRHELVNWFFISGLEEIYGLERSKLFRSNLMNSDGRVAICNKLVTEVEKTYLYTTVQKLTPELYDTVGGRDRVTLEAFRKALEQACSERTHSRYYLNPLTNMLGELLEIKENSLTQTLHGRLGYQMEMTFHLNNRTNALDLSTQRSMIIYLTPVNPEIGEDVFTLAYLYAPASKQV